LVHRRRREPLGRRRFVGAPSPIAVATSAGRSGPSGTGPLRAHGRHSRCCPRAIPDARLVVVEGDDHLPYVGDMVSVVREVERFLVGTTHHTEGMQRRTDVIGDPLSSLSAAELRVAECVAQGLGNPAIAEARHLSRHTVESHLKRIYTKLGMTRVQLAGIVSAGANR
jgi:DNA-binding CsgD family transcriptional regulator